MNTPIHDFLKKYAESGTVRLHMPGGKGINAPFDITEINGADELYDCAGIIRESEKNAARLFGAADTCFSCGGSTLSIQGMLSAACAVTGKRKIAAGRYSHKSLISTAILLGLDITWIYPDAFLSADIKRDAVEAAVDGETAAVFVNSVDYLGGEADISAISAVCKRNGVLLLADNAHGAYKVFTGDHPIKRGADMTADSAHKTLPALTGTAYLHLSDSAFYNDAKAAMSLFGSSSPSYLMLDSLDLCSRYIAENADAACCTIKRIAELKTSLEKEGVKLRESDAMRITADANAMGYSGHELADLMRQSGAECEMSGERYVVLLFSVIQPAEDFERVYDILCRIPKREPKQFAPIPVIRPEKVMTAREAYFHSKRKVSVRESVGMICADIASPCPPCVPIVMPGERITDEAAALMERYGVTHIRVVS